MMEIVKQLAVFLENKPGALLRISKELSQRNINIQAMSIADSIDHAVVRMVLDKPLEALHLLGEAGMLVVESDLLKIPMTDQPGELLKLCQNLLDMGINMEYAYGSNAPKSEYFAMYVRVMDPERVIEKFRS